MRRQLSKLNHIGSIRLFVAKFQVRLCERIPEVGSVNVGQDHCSYRCRNQLRLIAFEYRRRNGRSRTTYPIEGKDLCGELETRETVLLHTDAMPQQIKAGHRITPNIKPHPEVGSIKIVHIMQV